MTQLGLNVVGGSRFGLESKFEVGFGFVLLSGAFEHDQHRDQKIDQPRAAQFYGFEIRESAEACFEQIVERSQFGQLEFRELRTDAVHLQTLSDVVTQLLLQRKQLEVRHRWYGGHKLQDITFGSGADRTNETFQRRFGFVCTG